MEDDQDAKGDAKSLKGRKQVELRGEVEPLVGEMTERALRVREGCR